MEIEKCNEEVPFRELIGIYVSNYECRDSSKHKAYV